MKRRSERQNGHRRERRTFSGPHHREQDLLPLMEFSLFLNLIAELRLAILEQAAMAYQDRIVTTRIHGKNWRIIHKTAAVEKVAKSITLPFPLGRVSKEARKAVFSAASCHIFVDNRFKKKGEVRKIHFRPGDQLYIQGFHNICQRLQNEHIRFGGFGLGIGIKSIIIHPHCFGAVRADIAGFLRAVHSFEELEGIYVLTYFSRHADLHFQIANGRWHHYQLATNRSIAVTRDLADLLGNVPLIDLLTKPD